MKLLQVYNDYRTLFGGEPGIVRMIAETVQRHGGQARLMTCSSKGLDRNLAGKVRAFVSGIYNFSAYRQMAQLLRKDRPDVVHVHNLYPLFSPSVLVACRRAGVPVVMMANHNYLLTCPISSHLYRGRVCEKCVGGREHHCLLQNCRGSLAESAAYALRSAVARKLRLFHDNVTIQIVHSEFARKRLIAAGFDPQRIVVLLNMVAAAPERNGHSPGHYVAFSGRMMPEKGVDVLLAAALGLPDVPFHLAGDGTMLDELRAGAPANAHFIGRCGRAEIAGFYQNARFLVVPSKWFEGCPLVISEAMSHGLPVIASRIGGLGEFVEEGVTGLLFEPGNSDDLAEKIRLLWANPELCRRLGDAGRQKARRELNGELYYQRLTAIYERAIELTARRRAPRPAQASRRVEPPAAGAVPAPLRWPAKHDLFGVQLSATTCDEAAAVLIEAARRRTPCVASFHAAHAVVTASGDAALREAVNSFEMVTPDGQPVRWALNLLHKTGLPDRVYGPEVMLRLCRLAAAEGVGVYLYGGSPQVVRRLRDNLIGRFPKLRVTAESPPFRPLTAEEDEALVRRIEQSGAGIVFIGLGCPKQDRFAHEHRQSIPAVQVCVGAAFDFHAGAKRMAPRWMQRSGLEWLFRLATEPRRLGRRYLVTNSLFLLKLAAAWLRGARRARQG
jgi:exopolysaccharide biosynthesis WecB/TagA/CpsF family protein